MRRTSKNILSFLMLCMVLVPCGILHAAKEIASAKILLGGSSELATIMTPRLQDVESVFLAKEGQQARTGENQARIKYALKDIYPYIDLICVGDEYQIEYIFTVRPGGDPSRILLSVDGVSQVDIKNTGRVTFKGDNFELNQSAPIVFVRESPEKKERLPDAYSGLAFESTVCVSPGSTFDSQINNEEFLRFLNDTQSNPRAPRSANMFFDKSGRVWMNPAMQARHLLFDVSKSVLEYDPEQPAGGRYRVSTGNGGNKYFGGRPVAGVTWYGAVKFANWLTMVTGRNPSLTKYSEGRIPANWPKPPDEGWAEHFFNVTSSDDNEGFMVDTFAPPSSVLEIHFLVSFYDTRAAVEGALPDEERSIRDGAERGYVQPEPYDSAERPWTTPRVEEPSEPPSPVVPKEVKEAESQTPQGFGVLYKSSTPQEGDQDEDSGSIGTTGGGGAKGVTIVNPAVRVQSQYPSAGIVVTVSLPDLSGQADGTTSFTRQFVTNTIVTFTAPALSPAGGLFLRWLRDGVEVGTDPAITLEVDTSMTLTAVYENLHTLNVISLNPNSNVFVAVNPADKYGASDILTGIDFSRTYLHGTVVNLEASLLAPNGYRFVEWQSSLGTTYSTRSINVPVNSDMTLTAVYAPTRELILQSINPNNGVSVTIGPADVNGNGNAVTGVDFNRTYFNGTVLTLTAEQVAPGGNRFRQWVSSLGPVYSTRTINLNIISDTTLTARYEPPRTITLFSTNPDNGINVTATTDLNGDGDFVTVPGGTARVYEDGSAVTFTADLTGPGGTTFGFWQSSLGDVYMARSITVSPGSDFTLTAVYVLPRELTVASDNPDNGVDVTVTPDSNGDGDLATVPGGTTRVYDNNAAVTLVAPETAPGGNSFRHWENSLGGLVFNRVVNFNITADMTMTAHYAVIRTLTVISVDPGGGVNVQASPNDISGQGNGFTVLTRRYDDGENVTLTADDVSGGQSFLKWQRDDVDYSNSRTTVVTMDADYTMTAIYAFIPGPIDDPDPSPSGL